MSRPTEEELTRALKSAKLMREKDNDPFHLGKTLLHYHARIRFLEEVKNSAEAYLHSGLSDSRHRRLLQAIECLHQEERRQANRENPALGL
ncbi:MAG TPA: hypothetical protein ENI68_03770 [Gammaproteobacteria bacterium]|nr:hypothetical protein [Gammaproteobacteria bacterium]